MNIVKLSLFFGISAAYAAAGSEGVSVRLVNGLDGSITIPALHGLVLAPEEGQSVVLPAGMTELAFLYHNELNADELKQKVEVSRLSSIFEQCELRLVPDKDAAVALVYNGLQLHQMKAQHKKLARQETLPILRQAASVGCVARSKQRRQGSLQKLD